MQPVINTFTSRQAGISVNCYLIELDGVFF